MDERSAGSSAEERKVVIMEYITNLSKLRKALNYKLGHTMEMGLDEKLVDIDSTCDALGLKRPTNKEEMQSLALEASDLINKYSVLHSSIK